MPWRALCVSAIAREGACRHALRLLDCLAAVFSRGADNSRRVVAQHFDIPRVNLLRQGFLCYILAGFGMDSSFLSPTLLCS